MEERQQAQEYIPPESMDQVPQDRVFCTAVLFLTPDNRIAGGLDYNGTVLSNLQVPPRIGVECKLAAEHLERYLHQAITHAAVEAPSLVKLLDLFVITEEDLEQSDDSDEGSGSAESTGK